jgi:PadR family transcriptional regulator, regulatory protein PadR
VPPASVADSGGFGSLPVVYLRAALLLLIKEEPSYGYDLAVRLTSLGVGPHVPGLYKVLRALEDQGAINSDWQFSSVGPARRVYALTPQGEGMLAVIAGHIEDTCRSLQQYLDQYADACERDTLRLGVIPT